MSSLSATRPPRFAACALCLAGISGLLAAAGCGKGNAAAAQANATPAAIVVTLEPAVEIPRLQRYVRVVGSLAAYERATLSNRITGTIEKLSADLGDVVKPGQKLAEIEPDRFRLALEQSREILRETLARLGLTDIPTEQAFDVDSTSPVKKALADLAAAQNKYDRAATLYKQQLIKDFEWLDIQAGLHAAEAEVQSTRDDARALLAAAREARAVIQLRQKDLDDTVISAPSGQVPNGENVTTYRVAERRVSVGEYLREGTVLFTLVADDRLKLQVRVPEGELARVRLGQTVSFNTAAYGAREFSGKITTLDPTVDPANRTFMVEATVDNTQGLLRTGSFIQGRILTEQQPVVMVPVDSITSFAGVTKLFVADDDRGALKARQVEVRQGQQESRLVEILDHAVKPGERIVTTGQAKLVDGSLMEPRQPAATAPHAATTLTAGP